MQIQQLLRNLINNGAEAMPDGTITISVRDGGSVQVQSKPLNFPMILSFLSLLRQEEGILVVDDVDEIRIKKLQNLLGSP